MEMHVIQQAIYINMIKNQCWVQFIDDCVEVLFDQSLGRASLTCQLPLQTITIAISGSSQCLAVPHKIYFMMNWCSGNGVILTIIIITTTNVPTITIMETVMNYILLVTTTMQIEVITKKWI